MPGEDVLKLRRRLMTCWGSFVCWMMSLWMICGGALVIAAGLDLGELPPLVYMALVIGFQLILFPVVHLLRVVLGLPNRKQIWDWLALEKPITLDQMRAGTVSFFPLDKTHPANHFWTGWFHGWITIYLPLGLMVSAIIQVGHVDSGGFGDISWTGFALATVIISLLYSLWGVLGTRWLIRKYKRQAQESPA